jgi:hypothetical protein
MFSLSPEEGGSCNLEDKHGSRMAPRLMLFQKGHYRSKGHNPEKMSWV